MRAIRYRRPSRSPLIRRPSWWRSNSIRPMPRLNQQTFLRPGDQIRFGYRGPYYQLPGSSGANGATNATNQVTTTQGVDCLDPSNNSRTSPPGYVILPVNVSDYDTTTTPAKPIYRYLPPAVTSATGWRTPFQILRQPVKLACFPHANARQCGAGSRVLRGWYRYTPERIANRRNAKRVLNRQAANPHHV